MKFNLIEINNFKFDRREQQYNEHLITVDSDDILEGVYLKKRVYFVSHSWDVDKPFKESEMKILFNEIKEGYLWIDFICLPQPPRNDQQEKVFKSGLESIDDLLLILNKIFLWGEESKYRGWCNYEYRVSQIIKEDQSELCGFESSLTIIGLKENLPSLVECKCTNGSDERMLKSRIGKIERSYKFTRLILLFSDLLRLLFSFFLSFICIKWEVTLWSNYYYYRLKYNHIIKTERTISVASWVWCPLSNVLFMFFVLLYRCGHCYNFVEENPCAETTGFQVTKFDNCVVCVPIGDCLVQIDDSFNE